MGYFIGIEGRQFYLEDDEELDFKTEQIIKKINPEVMENPEGKTYKCDTCGKEFEYAIGLAGHKRSHK